MTFEIDNFEEIFCEMLPERLNTMDKKVLKDLLSNTIALEDAMKTIYRGTDQTMLFSFSNYKTFMTKCNQIGLLVCKEVGDNVIFDFMICQKFQVSEILFILNRKCTLIPYLVI